MSVVPFLLLLAATAAWILLPVIPALRELLQPTDAEPLNAVGHDAGDLTVFADGFRDYLARQLPGEGRAVASIAGGAGMAVATSPDGTSGTLGDGTPYVQLTGDASVLRDVAHADGAVPRIVIADGPLTLPGGETFLLEFLARGALHGGPEAIYRALLGEGDVSLGDRSEVLRWVHAAGDLALGRDCIVHGRASALGRMLLAPAVTFTRIRAARIATVSRLDDAAGLVTLEDPPVLPPVISGTVKLPTGATRERGYTRITGDFTILAGGTLTGALVVSGRLVVGDGARIGGSVKVHGECVLGDDVVIDGTLVSRRGVTMGARCYIRGSLAAERDVTVGAGSWIGGPNLPASVAADTVVLHSGVQVFGAVSARHGGRVG